MPRRRLKWQRRRSRLSLKNRGGCYRCHNDAMLDEDGEPIDSRCELCHYVLSEEDPEPDVFQCLHQERSVPLFD